MLTNPFEYGKPITNPARFFGRQSELLRLRDGCYQMRSISIVGERRVGKSSLLRLFTVPEFVKNFNFGDKYIFCFYDFQGVEDLTQKQFWAWVLTELAEKIPEQEKILLALLAILFTKGKQGIFEKELKDLYPRYKNDLLTLNNRSMVLSDNGNYRLFSPVFAEWIAMELTDISQKEEKSIEEWITQYEKSFLEKGLQKFGNIFKKVNPKYWELLRKILLLVRDPKKLIDLLDRLGQIF